MFILRNIIPQLKKELDTKQIIVLTGMRQVGKTTLLNYLFSLIKAKNKVFFDLENPLHRKVFEEENYDNIWNNLAEFGLNNKKKAYIFLDEIQNLPIISKTVKYLYDHYRVKFFLTGSSSFYLKNLFPESLAGRKLIFELFTLNFEEFLRFKQIKKKFITSFTSKVKEKNKVAFEKYTKLYQEYMHFGGFPAVVLENDQIRKKALLEEIFKSYFEKDVKNLADFKDISKLRDLILLLVSRVGSKLEISKLASELSVARETVYSYLSFLENTYFLSLLSKFTKSIDRQAAGQKKVYFSDTGLLIFLGSVSQGQMLENSVFQNLRGRYKLCFYAKNSSSEIDFILNKKIALEVKQTASLKDINNLLQRVKKLKISKAYIVTLNFSSFKNTVLALDL